MSISWLFTSHIDDATCRRCDAGGLASKPSVFDFWRNTSRYRHQFFAFWSLSVSSDIKIKYKRTLLMKRWASGIYNQESRAASRLSKWSLKSFTQTPRHMSQPQRSVRYVLKEQPTRTLRKDILFTPLAQKSRLKYLELKTMKLYLFSSLWRKMFDKHSWWAIMCKGMGRAYHISMESFATFRFASLMTS